MNEEQLRNRIAELEAENERIKKQSATRRIGLCKAGESNDVLREKLATYEAVVKKLRDIVWEVNKYVDQTYSDLIGMNVEWLAARYIDTLSPMLSTGLSIQPTTEHLDAYVKELLGDPVAWLFADSFGEHYTGDKRDWYDGVGVESVTPLYAIKEPK